MKYIMFEAKIRTSTLRIPVLFPSLLIHAEVAKALAESITKVHGWPCVPVSAGECTMYYVGAVGGGSDTLGLKHNPDDLETINHIDYGAGWK